MPSLVTRHDANAYILNWLRPVYAVSLTIVEFNLLLKGLVWLQRYTRYKPACNIYLPKSSEAARTPAIQTSVTSSTCNQTAGFQTSMQCKQPDYHLPSSYKLSTVFRVITRYMYMYQDRRSQKQYNLWFCVVYCLNYLLSVLFNYI